MTKGFVHFTVVHKTNNKQTYVNTITEETVEVHTNLIESSWNYAKQHFRKGHGKATLKVS